MITGALDILIGLILFLVAIPITVLTVLSPGLIAGMLAKRLGKKSWLWGSLIGFIFAIIISPKLLSIYFGIIDWEWKLISPRHEETVFVPLADAHKVVIHENVNNVNFDVPLNYMSRYMNRFYDPPSHGWQNVTKSEYEGNALHKVDQFPVITLLPDLEPISEQNYREFENLDSGFKVLASLGDPVADNFYRLYFKDYFDSLKRQPDDSDVPGMMHFHDKYRGDLFYSHDHPVSNFTYISCREDKSTLPHPTCHVDTEFVYKATSRFRLSYWFDRAYLPKWRDIDRRVKTLFERFGDAAPQLPPPLPRINRAINRVRLQLIGSGSN